MKILNLAFVIYGMFEIASGLFWLAGSLEAYQARFAITPLMDPAAMIFAKGFGNGLLCIGICAVLAFFVPAGRLKAAFAAAFVLMNAVAGWYCYTIAGLPASFVAAAYGHWAFALVFIWLAVLNLRRAEPRPS